MSTFLFLALNLQGFGETGLGMAIARDLALDGHCSVFLAPEENSAMFGGSPFELARVSKFTRARLPRYVDELVSRHDPAAIVLCDLHRCRHFMHSHEVDPAFLDRYRVPLLALDIRDQATAGSTVDLFFGSRLTIPPGLEERSRPLLPSPIVRPGARPGVYANLPEPLRLEPELRARTRAGLGLGEQDRAVLLCTASWQQQRFPVDSANVQVKAFPRLLGPYLAALGERVHLLHVGPAPFPLGEHLGARYHHLPALPPAGFAALTASVDLLLSPNVSATTMTRAIVSGIPVILLRNGLRLERGEELPEAFRTETVTRWLETALPLYPFHLWPLGWWHYLSPLLEDNPYLDAVAAVELLDERGVVSTCKELLEDGPARARLAARQRAYVEQVRALPSPRQAVARALG